MVSLAVIVLVVLAGLGAPLVSMVTGHGVAVQYRETGLSPEGLPQPPSAEFPLGTDDLGRDVLVRIVYGARVSLLVGVVATLAAVVVGVLVGLVAGFGGVVDSVLARVIDVVLAIPFLLAAVALVSFTGPSLSVATLVIAFFGWTAVARLVRGQVLSLREREFVQAARSLGAGTGRILFRDILPNVLAPVLVYAALLVPTAIVAEATLSFLGLGVPAPTASWGGMLNSATGYYRVAWWFLLFPSLALFVTTLAFNLFGDAVRDALQPRSEWSGRSGEVLR